MEDDAHTTWPIPNRGTSCTAYGIPNASPSVSLPPAYSLDQLESTSPAEIIHPSAQCHIYC
ncbi:hypothetical protein BC826DRAFT_1040487 [Russula brevipes]|nr:hypothetical protein BC826DRAFT_1040487 [Russula brevipes]